MRKPSNNLKRGIQIPSLCHAETTSSMTIASRTSLQREEKVMEDCQPTSIKEKICSEEGVITMAEETEDIIREADTIKPEQTEDNIAIATAWITALVAERAWEEAEMTKNPADITKKMTILEIEEAVQKDITNVPIK